jgi:hypothetical protein
LQTVRIVHHHDDRPRLSPSFAVVGGSMPRGRKYADGAAKQRAYRARKRKAARNITPLPKHDAADSVDPVARAAPSFSNEQKLRRVVDAHLSEQDPRGPKLLTKTLWRNVRHHLPECFQDMGVKALRMRYRRACESRPAEYDRWISLALEWAGVHRQYSQPEAADELVDDLITVAGENIAKLRRQFGVLEDQWSGGPVKFQQLMKLRDRLRRDPWDWPIPKPAVRERAANTAKKIRALMEVNSACLWTPSQVADKLNEPVTHIRHVMTEMRLRKLIERVDQGRGLHGLRGRHVRSAKLVATHIVELLLSAPHNEMQWKAMHDAIGQQLKSPMDTLRQIGVLEPPDPNRRGLLKLSARWIPRLKARELVRAGNGLLLWPTET